MNPEVRNVSVVVFAPTAWDAGSIHEALTTCGIIAVKIATTTQQCLILCRQLKPDLLIVNITSNRQAAYDIIRSIRAGTDGANRYLSIIAAKADPDGSAVREAINRGVHEFLALPTSVKGISSVIYRAVFISRPFVEVENYAGPCRRRRPVVDVSRPERRRTPWPGYIHAANLPEGASRKM
jgi:two-component system, chemotaxis family, chemotaxis protein CheY